ncbi:hypothetical protein [uncultured Thiodictyon sp.]|jgi:hypothetical protein|uniref:hypothetical protein n=1 Tax=uncultured Thiodictyon sp. TaxID=1846217 RepID=UPI0025F73854|nr:hypothetical protein [uncultured Thiodictyon sp.]
MTTHGNGDPGKTQRDRAMELLTHHPDFATQTGRLRLLTAAFGGVAGAEPILTHRPDLDGGPQGAAAGLVDFLAAFGQLGDRHPLALLLEQVRATAGDDQQGPLAALIRDLDAGCDQPPDAACPYRSLDAFREEDAPLFFGRGGFTDWTTSGKNPATCRSWNSA